MPPAWSVALHQPARAQEATCLVSYKRACVIDAGFYPVAQLARRVEPVDRHSPVRDHLLPGVLGLGNLTQVKEAPVPSGEKPRVRLLPLSTQSLLVLDLRLVGWASRCSSSVARTVATELEWVMSGCSPDTAQVAPVVLGR